MQVLLDCIGVEEEVVERCLEKKEFGTKCIFNSQELEECSLFTAVSSQPQTLKPVFSGHIIDSKNLREIDYKDVLALENEIVFSE